MNISRRIALLLLAGAAAAALLVVAQERKKSSPAGYTDTPMLPGDRWHVHDSRRPQPRAVEPGSFSTPGVPGHPPADAIVLFDGTGLSKWRTEDGQVPAWIVDKGVLKIPERGTPNGGDIWTRDEFGDCQLHVEWAAPDPPLGEVMNRGNSGIYIFGRYEIQVFDSYRGGIYADGQAAAIYGQYPPLVNASRPPGEWQVFDVLFTAPRFRDGTLERPAFVTLFYNGVAVHNHLALLGATGHRILPKYTPHGPRGSLVLQAHGNPVRYRNIWIRPLRDYDEP